MNERTDFGWFLHGSDLPSPDVNNVSFASGIFSATTGTSPNLFLLETGNPEAASLGKTGFNHPIDADFYKLVAIRMSIDGSPQAVFGWNRNNLWDGTQSSSNVINLTPGWRTYLVDLSALGIRSGSEHWNGLIRSLQFAPSYLNPYSLAIDWIRLVDVNPSLCRQVTWSGFAGAVDLYLDTDGTTKAEHSDLNKDGKVDSYAGESGPVVRYADTNFDGKIDLVIERVDLVKDFSMKGYDEVFPKSKFLHRIREDQNRDGKLETEKLTALGTLPAQTHE